MVYRVVLYAEGGGEDVGEEGALLAPGDALTESALGPGHVLIRRCLVEGAPRPAEGIRFETPLRIRGRRARGSDLHDVGMLRRLLTWAPNQRRPDLAVVLMDRDGDPARKRVLQEALDDIAVPHVIGVAAEEFETWLIADTVTVASVLRRSLPAMTPPESLEARAAKRIFAEWVGADRARQRHVRLEIAHRCDLGEVARVCRSFEVFAKELRARSG